MSSPNSQKHLDYENSIDLKKMTIFLKSVDERKPLGKLVKLYADQKFWDGWGYGVLCGSLVGVVFGGVLGFVMGKGRSS